MFSLESGGNQSLVSECCQQHWDQVSLFSPSHDSVLEFGGNKLVKLGFMYGLNLEFVLPMSTFIFCNHIGIREMSVLGLVC